MKRRTIGLLFILACVICDVLFISDLQNYSSNYTMKVIALGAAIALVVVENDERKRKMKLAYINDEESETTEPKRLKYFLVFGALGFVTIFLDVILFHCVTERIAVGLFWVPVAYVLYITSEKNVRTTGFLWLIILRGIFGWTTVLLFEDLEGLNLILQIPYLLSFAIQALYMRKEKKEKKKVSVIDLFGIEEEE